MTFGAPSSPDATGGAVEVFADATARYFANWSITLPGAANALRLPGAIWDQGWQIRWVFGRGEDGREYLEFYATHRLTNDRHQRVTEDGEWSSLPALQEWVRPQPATRGPAHP